MLRAGFDPDEFFRQVAGGPTAALLLDYDGTLAPFRRERDRAFPYPGVRERLTAILADGRSRLAIVSGRPLSDLAPLLSLPRAPELWGSHGLERRSESGEPGGSGRQPAIDSLVERAGRWAAAKGWTEHFEHKPFGFALHGRGIDPGQFQAMLGQMLETWGEEAAARELELLEFAGGFEFRPSGSHKGDVIRTTIAELPPEAPIAYLGDDRTDEDAFAALEGRGAGVLVRPVLRPTAADLWIVPPEELLGFLDRWREAARGRQPSAGRSGARGGTTGPSGN